MINILHYYCKPNRRNLLNNVTYQLGISCNVNDAFMDISDITKELTNKNHIHCIAIDEGLFGKFDSPEDIKTKIDVLRYLCTDTEILIIALDKSTDDEIITLLRQSGVADYVITKEMHSDFDKIVTRYLNGETKSHISSDIIEKIPNDDTMSKQKNVPLVQPKKPNQLVETDDKSASSSLKKPVTDKQEKKVQKTPKTDYIEITADKMITVGVCGLQPHIGTTHHALAMAKCLNSVHKNVCYKENNLHDAYRVLQRSSLAKVRQGHINMVGLDIFDRRSNIAIANQKYKICVVDFGYIKECSGEDFFATDIPIVVAGAKDWEIESFIGAYSSGVLDRANIIINFFPEHERKSFRQAFPETHIYFADYSPEVFEEGANSALYQKIFANNLQRMEI